MKLTPADVVLFLRFWCVSDNARIAADYLEDYPESAAAWHAASFLRMRREDVVAAFFRRQRGISVSIALIEDAVHRAPRRGSPP